MCQREEREDDDGVFLDQFRNWLYVLGKLEGDDHGTLETRKRNRTNDLD
jgi:hypothetical protein